jgi:hypothetical protein
VSSPAARTLPSVPDEDDSNRADLRGPVPRFNARIPGAKREAESARFSIHKRQPIKAVSTIDHSGYRFYVDQCSEMSISMWAVENGSIALLLKFGLHGE